MSKRGSLSPAKVYSIGDCPVGCGGDDLFPLLALPEEDLILFCPHCGVAWPRLGADDSEFSTSEELAPAGIAFPSRSTVVESYGAESIVEHEFEADNFWQEIVRTHINNQNPLAALAIVNRVLRTWHQPPEIAYEIARTLRKR